MQFAPALKIWFVAIVAVVGLIAPRAMSQPNGPGACCVVNSAGSLVCVVVTQSDCSVIGGQFHGRGATCNGPNPCPGAPIGACCIQPSGGGQGGLGRPSCITLNEVQCGNRGGIFQGNGTACTQSACPPPPPPVGGCCFSGGCVLLTGQDCHRQNGQFLGNNTSCTTTPCPHAPRGACCMTTQGGGGGVVCVVLDRISCANRGGVYQGDATACRAVRCPQPQPPTGACCLASGCVQLTPGDCHRQNGVFRGRATACTPSPCPGAPTGACCIGGAGAGGGGSAPRCFVLTELACRGLGGIYRGDGAACQSISCIPPTVGACCVAVAGGGFQCVQVSSLACATLGGVFGGPGIPCATVNCPPTPPPCPCDINADGVVDGLDEAAFLAGFAAMNMDLDGDGDTDLDDWNVFYTCFQHGGCP